MAHNDHSLPFIYFPSAILLMALVLLFKRLAILYRNRDFVTVDQAGDSGSCSWSLFRSLYAFSMVGVGGPLVYFIVSLNQTLLDYP